MFHSWREYRDINKAIAAGQLNQACSHVRRLKHTGGALGRRTVNKLIDRLIERAETRTVVGDFPEAWQDLTDAGSIAAGAQADAVTRKTNGLVDSTIERADWLLAGGKTSQASRLVGLLSKRRILDRRADRIKKICNQVEAAEQMAAKGELKKAISILEDVREQHPELAFVNSRIQSYDAQQSQLAELTGQLQTAIHESAWSGAAEVTQHILNIAPRHQVAIDALQRCQFKQQNGQADTRRPSLSSTGRGTDPTDRKSRFVISDEPSIGDRDPHRNAPLGTRPFLLWIDGVGGFMICTKPEVTIGRAVSAPRVDIPVQADIRRRHLRIRRVDGAFVADPLGSVVCAGKKLTDSQLLADRMTLDLGAGVQLLCDVSHPLGNSGCLKFTSRHRTEPWSDSVILMGDAILVGPNAGNHIVCPDWKHNFVIYRNGEEICFRGPSTIEVDGQKCSGDVVLKPNLHILGDDFSITCEGT